MREPTTPMCSPPPPPLLLSGTPHLWEPQVLAPRCSTPSPSLWTVRGDGKRCVAGRGRVFHPNASTCRVVGPAGPGCSCCFSHARFGGNQGSGPAERGDQGRAEPPVPLYGRRRQDARAGRCRHAAGGAVAGAAGEGGALDQVQTFLASSPWPRGSSEAKTAGVGLS